MDGRCNDGSKSREGRLDVEEEQGVMMEGVRS